MLIKIDNVDLIDILKNIALNQKVKCYIVGGYIRDYLLGLKNCDIDITIEGDGIMFAQSLNNQLNGKLKIHDKFKTATIVYKNATIDVVTARKEYYENPAKLPMVEFSNIYDDLARRDFSINTIAYDIIDEKIIDLFNGIDDLKKGIIRVLHDKSFIDDPTRIFRALRYSARYSFLVENNTEQLIRQSIADNYILKLSSDRIRNELFLILSENKVRTIIEKLKMYKIDKKLFGNIKLNTKNIEKSIKYNDINLILYRFLVLFYFVDENDLEFLTNKLHLSNKFFLSLKKLILIKNKLQAKSYNYDPIEISDVLKNAPNEILYTIYEMENEKIKSIIEFYINVVSKIKLSVNGNDIKRFGLEPGPLYTDILNKVFDAKLKGIIYNKNDEIKLLESIINRVKRGESI